MEVTIDGELAYGTVTFPGDESVVYSAEAASGVAGVYWARGTDQDPEIGCDWLVLDDGTQWGCICHPPFVSPCCMMRSMAR